MNKPVMIVHNADLMHPDTEHYAVVALGADGRYATRSTHATEAEARAERPLTVVLRSGLTVLAKMYHGQPSALTYANRTQAHAAAARVGGTVHGWRPFYVALTQEG